MSLVNERVITTIATSLGFAALIVACAGVYGLLAYIVSRQTSEIGLRLALGADRRRADHVHLRCHERIGDVRLTVQVPDAQGIQIRSDSEQGG